MNNYETEQQARKAEIHGTEMPVRTVSPGTGEIVYIPVAQVITDPSRPGRRFSPGVLEQLVQQMLDPGSTHPICVRKLRPELYELIAGEKWLLAAKQAGLELIPAVIMETEDGGAALKRLHNAGGSESGCDYFREAELYRLLLEKGGYTQHDLAVILGKSQSALANKLRLLRLPEDVRKYITGSGLSERHARALLTLSDGREQLFAAKKAAEEKLSVSKTEKLVRDIQRNRDILSKFYAEERKKRGYAEGKRNDPVFIYGNNVRNLRQVINIMKELVAAAGENGLKVQAGQKNSGAAVELILRIPTAENGICIRQTEKRSGIIKTGAAAETGAGSGKEEAVRAA